ncbi:MAG: hypothetical protein K4571_13580 [Deltaproteobacteria bacterium]
MKRYLKAARPALFLALIGLAILLNNAEVSMAKEFDASLNVMGYDRNVTVKINGVQISRITGGQSQSARLFLTDDPLLKTLPADRQEKMKELFCLKKGENIIEISFSRKGQPQSPSQFTVTIDSGNYKVPVLKYEKTPDVKEGKAKGVFKILIDEPAGYKTVILQ